MSAACSLVLVEWIALFWRQSAKHTELEAGGNAAEQSFPEQQKQRHHCPDNGNFKLILVLKQYFFKWLTQAKDEEFFPK